MVASSYYSASLLRAIRSPHLQPLLLLQRNTTLQQRNLFINNNNQRNNTRSFHATNANMVVKILGSQEAYLAAIEESKSKLVVIDFFATWCGPCKLVAPQVEKFSELPEFKENVGFYKLDVDELQEPAATNGVRAMPTFLLFKDGVKTGEVVGANAKALQAAISAKLA